MEFLENHPVLTVTLVFMAVSLAWSHLMERIDFARKSRSNLKYKFLDGLASFIHYGPDIGVRGSLSLDGASSEVVNRRLKGHEYLESKLGKGEKPNTRGLDLQSKLVDCRFALAKVCMPLLRELEFAPPKRNFITEVTTSDGIHKVKVDTGDSNNRYQNLVYCGSDAVHTLGVSQFHAPLQREINTRMELENGSNSESMLRFAPIAMNTELEKNANMILNLTGMDQVSFAVLERNVNKSILYSIQIVSYIHLSLSAYYYFI